VSDLAWIMAIWIVVGTIFIVLYGLAGIYEFYLNPEARAKRAENRKRTAKWLRKGGVK